MSFYNLLITITWVDFRSDWALCCCRFAFAQIKHLPLTLRFRAEQSFLGASDEPLLLLLTLRFRTDKTFAAVTLALRFRTENIRFAAGSRANTMLVTKALSRRDALSLRSPIADPRGVAQSLLQSTYSHGIRFSKMSSTFGDKPKLTILLRF